MDHRFLDGSGQLQHDVIDAMLPTEREKYRLQLIANGAPATVTGARDDPEAALSNLLAALEALGLITDSTTAS